MSKKQQQSEEAKVQEQQEVATEAAQEAVQEVAAEIDGRDAQIVSLTAEVAELKQKLASLNDQMLRKQADTDNYRKRLARDKEEAVQYANVKLISDLLQPLDDFDRAIVAAESTKDFQAMYDGIVMVRKQLFGMLERNWGLKQIEAVGKEFDPSEHEACMMVVDPNVEHETVLDDFMKGYKLHDRVIRPAKVRVSKPE